MVSVLITPFQKVERENFYQFLSIMAYHSQTSGQAKRIAQILKKAPERITIGDWPVRLNKLHRIYLFTLESIPGISKSVSRGLRKLLMMFRIGFVGGEECCVFCCFPTCVVLNMKHTCASPARDRFSKKLFANSSHKVSGLLEYQDLYPWFSK